MQAAVEHGLTGVHDAGVSLAELQRYQRLADRNQMPLRITAMADGDGDALAQICARRSRTGMRRAACRCAPSSSTPTARSAAAARRCSQDYSDDHGNRGLLLMSPEALRAAVDKAKRCGVQVATHAIGDRGNRVVLDAYANALGDGCGRRPSLAHRARAGAGAAGPAAPGAAAT